MTREFILARLAYIKAREKNFDRRTMRWRNLFYETPIEKIHVGRVDFAELPDEALVDIFERVLHQFYKQM